jgi:23S rRNA-/tRNA-specific pseudouridylate synthase
LIENFIEENLQFPGTYRVGNQKGKLAVSFFKILETYKRNCLIGFDIRTGRTHQIRVHAKFIGTPLAFDPLYNPQNGIFVSQLKSKFKQNFEEERSIIQRLSLHSQSLAFVHPITGKEYYIECPYPKDFEKAIEILRKYN